MSLESNYKKLINAFVWSLMNGDVVPLNSIQFNGLTDVEFFDKTINNIDVKTKNIKLTAMNDVVSFKIPEDCISITEIYLDDYGEILQSNLKQLDEEHFEIINTKINDYIDLINFDNEEIQLKYICIKQNPFEE